jgi:hypothetical protein
VGCRLPYWTRTCLMESRRLETRSLSVSFALWMLNTREMFTSVTSSPPVRQRMRLPQFPRILPSSFGGGGEDCAIYLLASWCAALCATPSSHISPSFPPSFPLSTGVSSAWPPGGDGVVASWQPRSSYALVFGPISDLSSLKYLVHW